jgi:hypothetical protein
MIGDNHNRGLQPNDVGGLGNSIPRSNVIFTIAGEAILSVPHSAHHSVEPGLTPPSTGHPCRINSSLFWDSDLTTE